jgi:hypothetical protein
MNTLVKFNVPQPDTPHQQAAGDLASLVSNASTVSKSELQTLIEELKALQQRMEDEGNRVRQRIAEYTQLNDETLELTKAIVDGAPHARKLLSRIVE